MFITSQSEAARYALFSFLQAHGVELAKSEDFQAIGRLGSGGKLIGVVGYNGFNGRVCSMHMAGEGNWISREFLSRAFEYPFTQLGMVAVFATVAGNNLRALKLDKHFGFEVIHRIPGGWSLGVDIVILEMSRIQCKYIAENKHERKAA